MEGASKKGRIFKSNVNKKNLYPDSVTAEIYWMHNKEGWIGKCNNQRVY